jgi:hypothetical protein
MEEILIRAKTKLELEREFKLEKQKIKSFTFECVCERSNCWNKVIIDSIEYKRLREMKKKILCKYC